MDKVKIRGRDYRDLTAVEIHAAGGLISDIRPLPQDDSLPILAPGLVDLQVNGYAGVDFNRCPIEEESVLGVTRHLWRQGVTTFLPTVITNGDEEITAMVAAIASARRRFAPVGQSVAGIHLEGPFISPEDGPRGAHDKTFVKAPDWTLFQRFQRAAQGNIRLLTLSPEWPQAPAFIRRCVAEGAVVSLGHTAADARQITAAVEAGATLSTHLGNGAHLLLPRHPNYIWEQLAQDRLWCAMIGDGEHLPMSVLKVFMRVKGARGILVSDATSLAGMPPGRYRLHIGGEVTLSPQGRLSMADNPQLLAGSARSLLYGVNTLIRQGLATRRAAWDMASVRPSALLNLPTRHGLNIGAPLDAVALRQDRQGELTVLAAYQRGGCVWRDE
ncbi:N-acetylglucosamine-6-phosphate deacetylase [Acerihabitans arboris]|uniref:N-acetylglucosamine-6-phosphate deacetylase n=1 Tax=Acerihabitans arboris TaxID=2691583 RepID=A0A845SG44_9GAMM|nr:N-acetylglucosamine-6-phosphate deacetylase [Acerihabitans arboris]NDL64033.1 N-acetylglucosamine-6-phosphate deacetylase [Acerihabitans arboris]